VRRRLTQARRAAQAALKKDALKPATLRLYDGDKKLAKTAHQNIIAIQGRKDALARAKDRAAPHLGHAEGLFANEDVPRIYARAAIVESLWRPEALSRSGAAGAYQFMAKTGRQFLAVEEGVVDERLDPLRASWAAARYMSQMAKSLEKWPLVLTAYNTGPARMKKVMKVRGTEDIGKIADAGDFGEFGFDGQNYYAQIAAIGRLTKDEVFEPRPVTGRAVRVEQPLSFAELASCVESPRDALAKANPALAASVIDGTTPVPAGYVAHVPSPVVATASVVDAKTLTSSR
jgi:membrane-bound lytic murein transglycosylase D